MSRSRLSPRPRLPRLWAALVPAVASGAVIAVPAYGGVQDCLVPRAAAEASSERSVSPRPWSAVGASSPVTEILSVSTSGEPANDHSADVAVSANGRHVVFQSAASNLVEDDTNGVVDAFLRDRRRGVTERVSVSSAGEEGNGESAQAAVSADGRFVAFQSSATNLVERDTNGAVDVFIRDRREDTTARVSVSTSGAQGDGRSSDPAVSSNARFVTFVSAATDLAPRDTNGEFDVYIRDRWRGTTSRVSVVSSGGQGDDGSSDPAVSDNGRFVVFHSIARNLVERDRNGSRDIFLRDRSRGRTTRINLSPSGAEANQRSTDPMISAGGRYVTYGSLATNLVRGDTNDVRDQFLWDRRTGTTRRVSLSNRDRQANDTSCDATISHGGRFVAFISLATDLVEPETNGWRQVFMRDRDLGVTRLVSVSSSGEEGTRESADPRISADGRFVAFRSAAPNLVPGDDNHATDVFIRGPFG